MNNKYIISREAKTGYEKIKVKDFMARDGYSLDDIEKQTGKLFAVNIHQLVSTETFYNIMETIGDIGTDPRLKKLNAIVFLSLKQKGRGEYFNILSDIDYKKIIDLLFEKGISFGFDSCSAERFVKVVKKYYPEKYDQLFPYVEPCESTLFSMYINTKGDYYPCSFAEGTKDWETGLSVLDCDDFVKDIWNHKKSLHFKDDLLKSINTSDVQCRNCPLFNICGE